MDHLTIVAIIDELTMFSLYLDWAYFVFILMFANGSLRQWKFIFLRINLRVSTGRDLHKFVLYFGSENRVSSIEPE